MFMTAIYFNNTTELKVNRRRVKLLTNKRWYRRVGDT